MALFRGFARKDASRGTNPVEVRKGQAGLFTPLAVGSVGARAGILPTGAWQLVAGDSGWRYAVGAFHAVTSRGPSDGAMLFGNDGLVYVGTNGAGDTVPPAPGSGLSRIDIIWVRHPTAGENSDTSSEPIFGVSSGTPLSVPVAPTIPTGAMELARNTMTSSATSTNSTGNSIAQTFPWAALRGTPVKVRSQAELDVLTPLASVYDPGRAYRIDTGQDLVNYGSGWRVVSPAPDLATYVPTWTASTGTPSQGSGGSALRLGRWWRPFPSVVDFQIEIGIGTAGASGGTTGAWSFGLPVPANAPLSTPVQGWISVAGTGFAPLSGIIGPTGTAVTNIVTPVALLQAGYNIPAGSRILLAGRYEG